MIKYIAKTEIDGIEIRIIYSQAADKYFTIYGLEKYPFESMSDAFEQYKDCCQHALECCGLFD